VGFANCRGRTITLEDTFKNERAEEKLVFNSQRMKNSKSNAYIEDEKVEDEDEENQERQK